MTNKHILKAKFKNINKALRTNYKKKQKLVENIQELEEAKKVCKFRINKNEKVKI